MTRIDRRDEPEIRTRLEESVGPVVATDLRAHLARDAVFVVSPGLSLVECGVAIAMDDRTRVEGWIAAAELRRPTAEERAAWLASDRRWNAIVVQPFVLVQDLLE